MSRQKIILAANLLLIAGGFTWGVYLLEMAKSKADYVTDRIGEVPLRCVWSTLGEPGLATLGLSHEPHHSWSDRSVAYVAFRAPPLPQGGSAEIELIALLGKRMDIVVRGEDGRARAKGGGIYRVALTPARTATIRTIELRTRRMQPPTAGGDSRWLGAAISRFRVCPSGQG